MDNLKRRKFRYYYIKSNDRVGIGLVEYAGYNSGGNWEAHVIAIHSIYIDDNLSNRKIQTYVYRKIKNMLADDERAILQTYQFNKKKNFHTPYVNRLHVRKIEQFRGSLFHTYLLAHDALRRKTTISEQFNEPMVFSVIKQYRKEYGQLEKETDETTSNSGHIDIGKDNSTKTE